MAPHQSVGSDIFSMNRFCFSCQAGNSIGTAGAALQARAHAIKRPEQIDGGRTGRRQHVDCIDDTLLPVGTLNSPLRRQDDTISGTDTDSRRTANHHVPNRVSDDAGIAVCQPDFLLGQQTLIQQGKVIAMPENCEGTEIVV